MKTPVQRNKARHHLSSSGPLVLLWYRVARESEPSERRALALETFMMFFPRKLNWQLARSANALSLAGDNTDAEPIKLYVPSKQRLLSSAGKLTLASVYS